ncbi:hypothetical protein HDU97_010376 [Phlyctochytrium planicorne]|nr:hypothetical protein HDU97_010376 [Phlyctochytrium planicorne]
MSSKEKYSQLPDIDISAQEVFETPDPIASDSIVSGRIYSRGGLYSGEELGDYEDDLSDEDIDESEQEIVKGSVPPNIAATRFEGNKDSSNSSASKAQARRKLRRRGPALPERDGYDILLGPHAYEAETKIQKLRRLMFEVEQLGNEFRESKQAEVVDDLGLDSSQAQEEATDVGDTGKNSTKKKKHYNRKLLLDVVKKLEDELGSLNKQVEGGLDPAVFIEGESAVGSLVRQTEYQKALIAQLKAAKSQMQAEAPSPLTSNPEDAAKNDSSITYELFYTPENAKMIQLSKIADIEKRLTNVERLVGIHMLQGIESGDDSLTSILQSSGNVVGALERLEHHLALLTQPRHLENVSRRVKTVTAEIERLLELRKKQQMEHQSSRFFISGSATSAVSDIDMHATQTETERKIDFLFSSLDKLDPLIGVIPHLLTRLHALRSLHTEASVFSDSLNLIGEEQKKVSDTSKFIADSIKTLETSVTENHSRMQSNFESLNTRLSKIVEKLEKK